MVEQAVILSAACWPGGEIGPDFRHRLGCALPFDVNTKQEGNEAGRPLNPLKNLILPRTNLTFDSFHYHVASAYTQLDRQSLSSSWTM